MSTSYIINEHDGVAFIEVCGKLHSSEEAATLLETATAELVRKKIKKVLVDLHRMDAKSMGYFDWYEVFATSAERLIQLTLRWAMVTSSDRAKQLNDVETMARNRGYELRGFHSIQDAEAWLIR